MGRGRMSYPWQEKMQAPSHADDWLITYADMITLLLCFFVLFLVVSISKKGGPHKEQYQQVIAEVETASAPVSKQEIQLPAQLPEAIQNDFQPSKNEQEEGGLAPPPAAPPQPVLEPKGDRITILEVNSAAFFDSGSATLNASGKTLLLSVAGNLKSDEFKDYRITVEGHTDDTPINTVQFPSNWELSTARASAVVRFFMDQGILGQKLRAAGYADTFPKAPNRDGFGNPIPLNQAENRRVIIKLEKIEKAQ
jgi:chemotaxis protein MotB